ncbi:MAG TPA: hypothetical protein PL124_02405 [Candidatus Cloacimonadota bacterium]|nr:hypothetical protein [Candidatus Cloacimonadota bacterium]HPS38243.1 hypothetical protein [Candidatus Cloacimonadota bacterium]
MKQKAIFCLGLLFVASLCFGIDDKFLHQMAHIKGNPAYAVDAGNQQVFVRNNNNILIYSTFNAWKPRLEAGFYSVFPIEDMNVAGDKYIYVSSREVTNTITPIDTLDTFGKIYFTTTILGDKLTREGSTLYIADRYRGIDIVDIGSGGQQEIRSTFSEKWGIRDFQAEYPYLYALNDFGLVTVDITDLQFPQSMDTNYELVNAKVIAKNGETLWIGAGKNLVAINIRNIRQPGFLTQYRLASEILDLEIKDNRLYIALGTGGMKILDVSNPLRIEDLTTLTLPMSVYDVALDADYIMLALGKDGWMLYQYR